MKPGPAPASRRTAKPTGPASAGAPVPTAAPPAHRQDRSTAEVLSGAQAVIRSLELLGIDTVFGLPGGTILPTYDPLLDSEKITHILVRHEAGAAHAAEGYARSTGKPGVVLVTSGPGATNAITGIADAFLDSIPMVVIHSSL